MYDGPVIDTDVHHIWRSVDQIVPYLDEEWRGFIESPGNGRLVPTEPALMSYPGQWGTNKRLDTFPAAGGPPGSDYQTMRDQLLDPLRIEHAVLSFDIGIQSGLANPYFAEAVCRAAVEWTLDSWLTLGDDRLFVALLVAAELPDRAAAEIRRLGPDPRVGEVLLVENTLGKPFGHPVYHPIYAAAEEVGLPVAIHAGGELIGRGAQPMAGGLSNSRLELATLVPQPAQHHLASMVTHGVFEKFPRSRVLMVEHGFSWLPSLLWNLDGRYSILKRESPWVKRLPSEYVHEHVRFSTQPFDMVEDRKHLIALLESYEGMEDLRCFASDYPHWDADEPKYLASRLPQAWLSKVFYENAAEFFGLERRVPEGSAA